MKNRTWENNMPHEHKPGGKTDQEGYDEGSNMGLKGNKSQVQNLFVQYIVISQEKNENVQDRVGTSAGSIAESLNGDELSEGRIEKINNGNDLFFWHKTLRFPRRS